MEGNFSFGGGGYLDELKAYVASRLLTFDNRSLDEIVKEFCDGYYGQASKYVIEYINLFEDNIKGDLWLYDDADSEMFTDDLEEKARVIINNALSSVSNGTKEYKHVLTLYLSYLYLHTVRLSLDEKNRDEEVNKLFSLIKELGVTEIFERTSLEFSENVVRKSRYCKNRENWYSLYYIMK